MSLADFAPAQQADNTLEFPAGTLPDTPGALAPVPGAPCADQALRPPVPSGTTASAESFAFSQPCPRCRAVVSLPWCSLVSGVLDRLDILEELPTEIAVLHARLGWLEAAVRALQAQAEEVQR